MKNTNYFQFSNTVYKYFSLRDIITSCFRIFLSSKHVHNVNKLQYCIRQLWCFLAAFSLTTIALAQTNTWEGDVSDDWNTGGNWSLGVIPTSSTIVVIGNGSPNNPVVKNSSNAQCNRMTMIDSGSLTIDNGGILTINGSNSNGIFMNSSGTLTVNGELNITNHNGFGIDLSGGTLIVGESGELTITDTDNDGIDIFNNTNDHQINGTLNIERTRDGISLFSNGSRITFGINSNVFMKDIEFDAIFLNSTNTTCTISGKVVIDGAGQDGLDIEGNGTLEIKSTGEVTLDNIDVDAVYLDSNNSTFIVSGKLTILGAGEDGIDVFGGQADIQMGGSVFISNITENGINGRSNSFENRGFISVNQCGGFEVTRNFDNLSTGTLQVDGVVNANSINFSSGSTLAPGSSPGCVTFNNNIDFSGVNFAIEIEGTTNCTQYDQVSVTGTVTLTNAILTLSGSHSPMSGETFVLIDNDGTTDPIIGTFAGLAEGATVIFNDAVLEVSYIGGDGNDVVLTYLKPLPDVTVPACMTYCNGESTAVIAFSGSVTGSLFAWTNTNVNIGLAASGTGNITSFMAINSTINSTISATIAVTPYTVGTNGVDDGGTGDDCLGTAKAFTITVFNDAACANTCASTDLVLDENSTEEAVFHASATITSNRIIADNTVVVFKAGTSITLQEGFHAVAGSSFIAQIEACPATLIASEVRSRTISMNTITQPKVKVFPNPVRTYTNISINLPEEQVVQLEIYDLNGRKIATIVPSTHLFSGTHTFEWSCDQVQAGIYFVVMNGRQVGRLAVVN